MIIGMEGNADVELGHHGGWDEEQGFFSQLISPAHGRLGSQNAERKGTGISSISSIRSVDGEDGQDFQSSLSVDGRVQDSDEDTNSGDVADDGRYIMDKFGRASFAPSYIEEPPGQSPERVSMGDLSLHRKDSARQNSVSQVSILYSGPPDVDPLSVASFAYFSSQPNRAWTLKWYMSSLVNSYFSKQLAMSTFLSLILNSVAIAFIIASVATPTLHSNGDHSSADDRDCTLQALMINVLGLLNVALFLPTLGTATFHLYNVGAGVNSRLRRTAYLHFCEVLVVSELCYVVFLVILIITLIATGTIGSCFHGTGWLEVSILSLSFLAFFFVWLQLVNFARLRVHCKFQLGSMDDRDHTSRWGRYFSKVFNRCKSWRKEDKNKRKLKKKLVEAVNKRRLSGAKNVIQKIKREFGVSALRSWYKTRGGSHLSSLSVFLSRSTQNPLHVACSVGDLELVDLLIGEGISVNSLDKVVRTKVSLIEVYRLTRMLLWTQEPRPSSLSTLSSTVLVAPLHVATVNAHVEVIHRLCDAGADVNIRARSSFWNSTARVPPLFLAESPSVAQALLSRGANLLAVPGRGNRMTITALQHAALKDRTALLPLLEDWGGDVALTPLHAAAAKGDRRKVAELLRRGVDVNCLGELYEGVYRRTPLHWAAIMGQTYVVKLLVQAGAHVDAEDVLGRTPLQWAARNNHASAVEALVMDHADPNHVDHSLLNVFCAAAENEQIEERVFKALCNAGGDINSTALPGGDTALHIAMKSLHRTTAVSLLAAGSDWNILNGEGRRAFECTTSVELQFAVKKFAGNYDVILCCTASHHEFGLMLQHGIEEAFITTLMRKDQSEEQWRALALSAMDRSSVLLCVLTEDFATSSICMEQLSCAKRMRIPVVACQASGVRLNEELQVYLFTRQIVPFQGTIVSSSESPDGTWHFEVDEMKFGCQLRILVDGLRDEVELHRMAGSVRLATSRPSSANIQAVAMPRKMSGALWVNNFVFLCHGDCHSAFVTSLYVGLTNLGVQCFLDSSSQTSDLKERILEAKDAILRCSAFVCIISDQTIKTELVSDQLAFAEDKGKPIIPLYITSTADEILELQLCATERLVYFAEELPLEGSFNSLVSVLDQLFGVENKMNFDQIRGEELALPGTSARATMSAALPPLEAGKAEQSPKKPAEQQEEGEIKGDREQREEQQKEQGFAQEAGDEEGAAGANAFGLITPETEAFGLSGAVERSKPCPRTSSLSRMRSMARLRSRSIAGVPTESLVKRQGWKAVDGALTEMLRRSCPIFQEAPPDSFREEAQWLDRSSAQT